MAKMSIYQKMLPPDVAQYQFGDLPSSCLRLTHDVGQLEA